MGISGASLDVKFCEDEMLNYNIKQRLIKGVAITFNI